VGQRHRGRPQPTGRAAGAARAGAAPAARGAIEPLPALAVPPPQKKLNINDWSTVEDSFADLHRKLDKFQKASGAMGVPTSYVRVLVELEDAIQKTFDDKELKKKMSATNAKAFNTMRQRVKKHNVGYTEQIQKFRDNPVEDDDDDEVDESSSSGEEEKQAGEEEEERQQGAPPRLLALLTAAGPGAGLGLGQPAVPEAGHAASRPRPPAPSPAEPCRTPAPRAGSSKRGCERAARTLAQPRPAAACRPRRRQRLLPAAPAPRPTHPACAARCPPPQARPRRRTRSSPWTPRRSPGTWCAAGWLPAASCARAPPAARAVQRNRCSRRHAARCARQLAPCTAHLSSPHTPLPTHYTPHPHTHRTAPLTQVGKKLREIVMTRGRRGTDKQEQVEMLTYLVQVSKGAAQRLEVLAQLVSSLFDLNPTSSSYLKLNLWRKCVVHMLEIMKLLQVRGGAAPGRAARCPRRWLRGAGCAEPAARSRLCGLAARAGWGLLQSCWAACRLGCLQAGWWCARLPPQPPPARLPLTGHHSQPPLAPLAPLTPLTRP
jgi:hypothetical protein